MRLYLDTNMLVFLSGHDWEEIDANVKPMLEDYSNRLMTSTVCVHELIHLFQIGKMHPRKDDKLTKVEDFAEWLSDMGIDVVPISVGHLRQLSTLPFEGDHRDPNDRLIIAQAISDRIPLVSSDRKFGRYERDGLLFVYNKR